MMFDTISMIIRLPLSFACGVIACVTTFFSLKHLCDVDVSLFCSTIVLLQTSFSVAFAWLLYWPWQSGMYIENAKEDETPWRSTVVMIAPPVLMVLQFMIPDVLNGRRWLQLTIAAPMVLLWWRFITWPLIYRLKTAEWRDRGA